MPSTAQWRSGPGPTEAADAAGGTLGDVEVARADRASGARAPTTSGGQDDDAVSRAGFEQSSGGQHSPPSCRAEDGTACASPVLTADDLVDAVDVAFGAVVLDASLTVWRLQMRHDRAHVRWRSALGDRATATSWVTGPVPEGAQPGSSRLERSGTTLLVGTTEQLHAVGTKDGHHRWAADLGEFSDGRTAWRGWVVDDAVFAVNTTTIAVLDAEDGRLVWHEDGPFTDVLPLASGAALLRDAELVVLGPDGPVPRWVRDVGALARFPRGTHRPNHGPIPLAGGGARSVIDARTGEVLVDLGRTAAVTRSTDGQIVVVEWGAEDGASAVVGFGADGRERWRVPGPQRPCCHVELRPTEDGRVLALFPGGAEDAAGWLLDPTTGAVVERVHRPADVAWIPRVLSDSTVVWMDGEAFVATDPGGTPRWRADSESRLLSATPLLLGTRDGLVRPSSAE